MGGGGGEGEREKERVRCRGGQNSNELSMPCEMTPHHVALQLPRCWGLQSYRMDVEKSMGEE